MNIEQILAPDIMYALGWALIHSLWQGAMLAILLALAFLIFRKASSSFRYRLSLASLTLVFMFFIGTFITVFQLNSTETEKSNLVNNNAEILQIVINENPTELIENQSFMTVYADYFNRHLPFIVTLWFLGMMVFTLRFLGSLAFTQRLRHSHHFPMSLEMESLLFNIQQRMDFTSKIKLVESALIQVPMVIGYLKPMILMPIGLVNQLNIHEVEAILAHELAHLKRYDYLVNIIQSIIETILFFHPAVWWISGEIRRERENCCDDLALEITDAITFAKALAKAEQFRSNFIHKRKPQLTMAALNNKNQLLNRVRRILNQPQKNQSSMKGLFAACILVVSFVATSLDAQQVETKENIISKEITVDVVSETPKTDFPVVETVENTVFPTIIEEKEQISPELNFPESKEITFIFDDEIIFVENKKGKTAAENVFFAVTPQKKKNNIVSVAILKDTSINGAITEMVIVREVAEKDGTTKEVKIKIKTKSDKKEIEVFENGRKLSESEQKVYQKWIDEGVYSTESEKQWTTRAERENEIAKREMEWAVRKEQEIARTAERETRLRIDEERRAIAEEKMKLAEEELKIKETIEKEHAIIYRELTKDNEKLIALEKEQAELLKKIAELKKTKQEAALKEMLVHLKEMELEIKQAKLEAELQAVGIAQFKDVNAWIYGFKAEMLKDGIIQEKDKKFKMRMDKDGIKVNGKKLTEVQEKKYFLLYKELTGKSWSADQTVEVNM